jgi:hypothetical protein
MLYHFLIAGTAFFGIFILFLVLSRTLNTTINHLVKLHYLLQKELDIKKESLEITHLLEDEKAKNNAQEASETGAAETRPNGSA